MFVLKHTKPPINSVLKMLVDLFSFTETTELFYTNDIKVLIDILVRQLSDLSAGDVVSCQAALSSTHRFYFVLHPHSFANGISNYVDAFSATLTTPSINIVHWI